MKKSEFFSVRSLFAGLCGALALVFAFVSCDTGLGEAIDTSAPVVTVTGPESGAVLSGTVNISGTCVDDKAIARVAVTVTNTATGAQAGFYNATISGNTWTLAVKNLIDGTYSASAVCYDTAGRQSGVASRVFDVDSTPPVFCVTKPNSLSITDPAAYGRDVTIKGEIADDHAVKQMDVRVFKVQGGLATEITGNLNKTTFSGFETAGGTEVTIAKFFPDSEIPPATSDDYPLYLNYKAMYSDLGAQVGDTVNLYIFPYLTDAAGNVSDKCYIQSSLKQLTAKACNVDTTSDSLQTAQFKKILNGSYSLGEVDVTTVKTILYGDYDQSSIGTNYLYYASLPWGQAPAVSSNSPLAMSVNANNSPMYEFGGFSVDRSDLVFAEVANKGTISVKVSAGLDGNEIIANTVRVYLWECSDTLNLRPGADLNILSTASYSSDNAVAAKAFKVYDSEQNEVKDLPDSTRVSTATYKIVLPDNLSAGVHYLMTAGGVDVAGNKFYSTGTYAFMVATSGDAPKVDFDDRFFVNARAIDKTQSDAYKAVVQITDKTASGSIPEGEGTMQEEGNWVKVSLSLYKGYAKTKGYLSDGDLLQTLHETTFIGSAQIKKKDAGEFYVEVPVNGFDLTGANKYENYTVAMQVQAKNIGATSESTTYIFWADAAPPALTVTAPARESGTSESVPIYIFETDKNISVDTSGATPVYKYTSRGTWGDISGSGTSEIFYAWDAPASPAINWTPAAGTAVDGVTYYTKQAGDGATGLYLADTGIKAGDSVAGKYTLSLGGDWTAISEAPKSVSNANWNKEASVSNSSDRTLNVVAVDQTGNMSAVTKVSNIMFDFAAPRVTAPIVNEYYTKSDATSGVYPFVITVLDESGLKSLDVTAKKYNAATKAYEPVTPGSSGYTLVVADDKTKATITLKDDATSDGKWQFGSVATDKAMRVGAAEFAFTIDTVPPERVYQYTNSDASKNRMITIGAEGSDSDWHNSENLTIKGKYKEWTSGLDRVDYTVTPPSPATPVDGSEAIGGLVSSAAGDVAYTLSPIGFKEGSNSIAIKGVDLAGNASTTETYTIKVDTTAPLVNTAYYTYDGVNLTKAAGTVMSNGLLDMTVFGTLDEKLSGIKILVLKMNNAVVSGDVLYTKDPITGKDSYIDPGTTWAPYDSADNKAYTGFKATIDKSKLSGITGDVDLYAVATDIAGNVTEQRKFAIHIDTDAPVISVMSPDVNAVVNGSVTFTGAVDDPALSGVQAYWSFDSSETIDPSRATNPDHEIVDGSTPPKALLDGTYSWNIKNYAMSVVDNANDKITFVDGSEYEGTSKDVYIKILARDKAANQAVKASKYTIDPNGDRPKIILTSGALSGMSPTNYVPYGQQKLEGAIEDDDGITKLECSYKSQGAADWSAWEDITSSISGGAWSFDVPADNKYALRFKVTDKSGAVFESTKTGEKNIYLSPVIAGTDATFSTGDTYLYLQVDTKRPEYSDLAYSTSDSASGTYTPTALPEKLGVVGGQKKFVKMNFYAKDDNGIDSVSLTLNGVKYTGTVGAYDIVNKRYPCEICAVDVSGLASDVYAAKLEIKGSFESDVTTENIAFTVDNTPPAVNPLSPDSNQIHGLITVYGTVDGSNSMKYALSLSESEKPADGDYKGIAGVGNTWFVYLDGGVSTLEESHDITLESYIIAKHVWAKNSKGDEVEATEENIRNQSFDAIVPIYIWIKAVDDVGNIYEKPHLIKFDPQGGRPTVTFGYPEANEARVGGEVKLYGGSDCVDGEGEVKAVFLQIISAQHNKDATTVPPYTGGRSFGTATYSGGKVTAFEPSANDMDYLKAMGYKVVKMRDYPATETIWPGSGTASDYGVVADFKGGAWSLRINGSGEFNPKVGESGTNQLIVCAYAYNGSKMNLPQYRQMLVDADSPTISDMFIKQYDSGSVLTASKAYTNGVYVKGASNLEFDLKDGDDIAKVFIGKSDESAAKAKDDAVAQKAADITPVDHKVIPSEVTGSAGNYHAKIALATASGVGSKYLYVIFADMKGNSGTQAFNINYDNVQPAVASTNIPTDVHNSDGYYSVEAKVTEAVYDNHNQSGFERFVVYFKRGNKVFDPMISKKKAGAANPDNWVDVSGMTVTDGLYWAQKTVEREAANLNVIKLSSGDASAHIHAGRLVKIGGAYYRITGVTDGSGNEKLITLDGQVEESFTTAYFAYGESVDNNKKETGNGQTSLDDGYGYGYPKTIANDDGDLMEEWANIQGTTCNLSAKINSRNIPDGSVEIYYSVFDKAGNVTTGSVTGAYVSNNAPRLANVIVESDHNYNGVYTDAGESRAKFTDNEKPSDWASAYKTLDLGSAAHPWIAAKGATRVKPEILGGNGALTWTCKYAGSADPSAAQPLSTDTPLEENKKRTVNRIVLDEISLKGADAGTGLYEINVLDSTEGGAQKAVINLWMTNDVNDHERPAAKTKRFYWKNLTNNSVYGSSSAKSQLDLKGHIELEETWSDGQIVFGSTPKVSGKIVIRGTIFDNVGIKEIKITVPGILPGAMDSATTVATCDFTKTELSARWTQKESGDLAADGYHFALDADEGGNVKERYTNTGHFVSWTLEVDTEKAKFGTDNLPAKTGENFILSVVDKNGNLSYVNDTSEVYINWEITVYATDEQAAAGKYYAEERFAAADESEGFVAADYNADEFEHIGDASDSDTPGVNKYVHAKPVDANYTMDIVPYITKVKTSLSAVNATNGVTDRSSLGHYPVFVYKNSTLDGITDSITKKNEDVEIYGFNLKGAKYGDTSDASYDPAKNIVTINSSKVASGAFELTVGGIATINNTNDNDAKGSYAKTTSEVGGDYSVYKNYYNRQPNNANNNNLTDDIAFDVWQLNAYAAAPMYGNVEDPQMKIQPFGKTVEKQAKVDGGVGDVVNDEDFVPGGGGNVTTDGKIGFAFANASSAFSMPNSDHSWTYWNYGYTNIRHTALAYDPAGYAWSSAAGQDVNGEGNSDIFYLESTHWRENGGVGTSGAHLPRDTKIHSACKLETLTITGDHASSYLDRIQSPSIAATTHGLYMAYYDKASGVIRYRAGAMTGTYNDDWKTGAVDSGVWAPDGESKRTRYWEFKNGYFKNQATSETMSYNNSLKNVQIVSTSATPNVCIAAIDGGATRANDVAVMVWCDGSKVSYAYTSGDPMKDNGKTGDNKRLDATWTTVDDIFGGKVKGGDCKCQIAVDAAQGVHIAAYAEKGMDIWYAYLAKASEPENAKVCKVDSYGSTGEYLTIDVALAADSTAAKPKPIPQIGYYSTKSTRPKFARWNVAKGDIFELTADKMQGTDDSDSFTGNWEVTNVPTQRAVRVSDGANKVKQNINIGVWKDAGGKLAYSTKNGLATGAVGTSDCHVDSGMNTTGNYGDVYGNGTRNAVLGYMWGDSADAFIETAQRMGNNDYGGD